MHTKPVPTVDQRRPSLGLFHEIPEEMGLGIVGHLDTSFRYNTAIVRLSMPVAESPARS